MAVVAEALGRTYRGSHHSVVALSDVSLQMPFGSVYGLLGRNGAGKTTFLRIAATQLMPTAGRMQVLGHDVVQECRRVRECIAVIPQDARPLYYLTVDELIFLYLRMRGMERKDARERTDRTLEELSLQDERQRLVSHLSGGLRRRSMVAMVMASDAELLFLDEPTTGLDPIARREVWAAIRRATRERRTVILTTHYLDEAEALANHLALLEKGRLLVEGNPESIRARVRWPYRVTLPSSFTLEELQSYGEAGNVGNSRLVFTQEKSARELTLLALQRGEPVSMAPVSLEDVFLQLVGQPLDEGEVPEEGA